MKDLKAFTKPFFEVQHKNSAVQGLRYNLFSRCNIKIYMEFILLKGLGTLVAGSVNFL